MALGGNVIFVVCLSADDDDFGLHLLGRWLAGWLAGWLLLLLHTLFVWEFSLSILSPQRKTASVLGAYLLQSLLYFDVGFGMPDMILRSIAFSVSCEISMASGTSTHRHLRYSATISCPI